MVTFRVATAHREIFLFQVAVTRQMVHLIPILSKLILVTVTEVPLVVVASLVQVPEQCANHANTPGLVPRPAVLQMMRTHAMLKQIVMVPPAPVKPVSMLIFGVRRVVQEVLVLG